jgi:cytochrome c-type biogenesis protein CcmH/NrfG
VAGGGFGVGEFLAYSEALVNRTAEQIADEIALRQASLEDINREVAAGELSAEEAQALIARDRAAIAALRGEQAAVPAQRTRRVRRRRKVFLLAGLIAFFLASAAGLLLSLSARQQGASISGSISLSQQQEITQQLGNAEVDLAQNHVVSALAAYATVLRLDPHNATALIETGWLDFSAGSAAKDHVLVTKGIAVLREGVEASPKNPAGHMYYGIVADSLAGGHAVAVEQFREFLALRYSVTQLALAKPYLVRLGLAKA